jgi:preprotein translocase SecE subunit
MSYGLYKSGQGYWVRVLAASMAGIVLLAACGWAWTQLEAAAQLLPKPRITLSIAPPLEGTGTPGQLVTLYGEPDEGGKLVLVGTAQVRAVTGNSVEIEKAKFEPRQDESRIKTIAPAVGGATLAGKVALARAEELFPPMYLQAAGVAALMILGALLTWWLVGSKPRTVEFLIATDGEMKKVNWSTKKDVTASTWVVIMWSVLLAAGLFTIDFLFSVFFKAVGVLEG